MITLRHPILIERGGTLTIRTQVNSDDGEPMDLTGCSAKMQVWRPNRPLTPPVLDLETDDGILFEEEGVVLVTATAEQTRLVPYVLGRKYQFALFLRSPTGHVYPLAGGRAMVHPGIIDEIPEPPVGIAQRGVQAEPKADYSWIKSTPRTKSTPAPQEDLSYAWIGSVSRTVTAPPTGGSVDYSWITSVPATVTKAAPTTVQSSPYEWVRKQ